MKGEAYMAYQPFYVMNVQNQEENWETLEEKDWDYMKEMYPQMAREIQDKVDEECDKLEYDGSMMFDEYPDKLMIRTICERIYKKMQDGKGEEMSYAEDEEEVGNEAEHAPVNMDSSGDMPIEDRRGNGMPSGNMRMNDVPTNPARMNHHTLPNVTNGMGTDEGWMESMSLVGEKTDGRRGNRGCVSCRRHSLHGGAGFLPPRPLYGGVGFLPPHSPHGGVGYLPPRPLYGGAGFLPPHQPHGGSGYPSPRPSHGEPGIPPSSGGMGGRHPRPSKQPCSCPPGRPCRDCLVALQYRSDWTRDMIEVLLYQEMLHRRSRRRRRRYYPR